jgi:alkanesulfonate monooxygenase SsuD/methylene tetrahydromethanopterin reductase-like flavin-dependent oxidoreductase (luciferase family)
VFSYDHIWLLPKPGEPAIAAYPLLGAICSRTSRIGVGTLVARIGLVPEDYLLNELLSIEALSGGRLVAGLGTGDRRSAAENRAYGIDYSPVADRRAVLERTARSLVARGVPTWIGAGARATNAVARRVGCVLNFWAASPARIAEAARRVRVTWAGNLPRDPELAATRCREIAAAGSEWIVYHWPGSAAPILEAAGRAELPRAAEGPSPR